MKPTTKKWIGGFVIGLITGAIYMNIFNDNYFIKVSLGPVNQAREIVNSLNYKNYCSYEQNNIVGNTINQ